MHIVSALTAYRILTFTHLGERHSIVSMGNWNSCSSELYENCFEQYNFGSNFHIWRKRKEQGQVSFWNKFEGLKFTKVTIFLNMRQILLYCSQNPLESLLMRFCLGLGIILPRSRTMLWIFHVILVWCSAEKCFDAFQNEMASTESFQIHSNSKSWYELPDNCLKLLQL